MKKPPNLVTARNWWHGRKKIKADYSLKPGRARNRRYGRPGVNLVRGRKRTAADPSFFDPKGERSLSRYRPGARHSNASLFLSPDIDVTDEQRGEAMIVLSSEPEDHRRRRTLYFRPGMTQEKFFQDFYFSAEICYV